MLVSVVAIEEMVPVMENVSWKSKFLSSNPYVRPQFYLPFFTGENSFFCTSGLIHPIVLI